MSDLNKKTIVDLDVYGRNSSTGGALVHENDFAISNAIVFFLTTRKGDYLYNSDLGGVLDKLLFKFLDENEAFFFSSQIQNELKKEFGSVIDNINVLIIPNYENRYYEIRVFYKSLITNQNNEAVFFTKPISMNNIESISYIDVDFEGDNLIAFVTLNLSNNYSKLVFNHKDGKWYWGKFRLNKLNETSPVFQEVFDLINTLNY